MLTFSCSSDESASCPTTSADTGDGYDDHADADTPFISPTPASKPHTNKEAHTKAKHSSLLSRILGPYAELLSWTPVSHYPLIFITLASVLAWFSTNFVFYGLYLNIGDIGSSIYLSQALASLVQLPASALSSIPLEELGRKGTLIGGLATGSISCFITVAILSSHAALPPFLPRLISLLAIAGVNFAFAGIYVSAAEVFPLHLVGVGLGVCQSAARISGVIAPFVSLLPKQTTQFIVFGAVAGGSAGAVFMGVPETKRGRKGKGGE